MSFFKNIILSTFTFTTALASAQSQDVNNYDYYSTTVEKTIPYEKDGTVTPIKMKIVETRNYSFVFEEEDMGKIDKDLIETPASVTKKIYVDHNNDNNYDKFIVLSYEKSDEDKFEIIPTDDSVAIKIDNTAIEPITSEGFIIANTSDADIVMVETYASL